MRTGDTHSGRTCARHGRGKYPGMYLGALALTLLAVAACSPQARGRASAPSPTVTAAATATPMPHLAFRPVALPPGFDQNPGSIAVSPVDGKDAWACVAAGNGLFQIWATTDDGSTWHAAGQLHPATPQPVNGCSVFADQRDTQAAVFSLLWGAAQSCEQGGFLSYYTRDSGQHWQQLPGWTAMSSVETDGATVYALLTIITPIAGQPQLALFQSAFPPRLSAPGPCPTPQQQFQTQVRSGFMVSTDGLHTWRELHPGGSTAQDPVSHYWHSPTSGDLFAATNSGALWHSPDGGANWTQMSTPGMQIGLGRWLANRKAWMFCGWQGQSSTSMCSMDSGNTWKPTPTLTVTVHVQCDAWCHQKGGQDSQTFTCQTFGIDADGSLLAICPHSSTATDPIAYRLSPGATAWTVLGSIPSVNCSVSANDITWCPIADTVEWETGTLPA